MCHSVCFCQITPLAGFHHRENFSSPKVERNKALLRSHGRHRPFVLRDAWCRGSTARAGFCELVRFTAAWVRSASTSYFLAVPRIALVGRALIGAFAMARSNEYWPKNTHWMAPRCAAI